MLPLRLILLAFAALLLVPAGAAAQLPAPCVPPVCSPGGGGGEPPEEQPPPEEEQDEETETRQPAPYSPDGAVEGSATFHIDGAHTGYLPDARLVPPLRQRWTRKFEHLIGAPLYGEGRIYVNADGALRALDPRTGADLWAVPTTVDALGAYDQGRVFTGGGDGYLRAFAAGDGRRLWEVKLSEYYSVGNTIVASGGVVYVGTPGGSSSIAAIDAASGDVRWAGDGNGTENMPAVDGERVYASYACGWTYAWDRRDGTRLWNTTADCSGGGGSTPSVYRGRLYVPENLKVLEAATGAELPVPAGWNGSPPVFAGDVGVFPSDDVEAGTVLRALDLDDDRPLWSITPDSGEATYGAQSRPIAVGATLYTLEQGRVAAYSLQDGAELWRETVPFTDEFTGSVYTGEPMAAGPGMLMIPGGRSLTAYESLFQPGPGEVQAGVDRDELVLGARGTLAGVAGADVRGGGVTVEADPAGGGAQWLGAGDGATRPDGGFAFSLRPDRNTRFRVRAGAAMSSESTVWVFPRVSLKLRPVSRTHFAVVARVRGPRGVRLAGRRAIIYFGRQRARRLLRLGSARLARVRGGAVRARIVVRRLRRVGRRDFVAVCIPRQHRLGLGRPDVLLRNCGKPRIRFTQDR